MGKAKKGMMDSFAKGGDKGNGAAALAVARMEADKSYKGIAPLLKAVIRSTDEAAWGEIKAKIEYTYQHLDTALAALNQETAFLSQVRARIEQGQKLLFKPNLVNIETINPYTLLPLPGFIATTDWAFVAAVMRWFHDKGGISYYRMCLGEAATVSAALTAFYTHIKKGGRPVTAEAIIEGRSDDFYGGWGFYFVRRYLAEASDASLGDDPMQGLEESMGGIYLPPGMAHDKLMVYDLNRIADDSTKGRDVPVPNAENFKSILLHKVVVGGDPSDAGDRQKYPGSVLVNMPKLKVHNQALFTNAIKNLGIGLYPMQASRSCTNHWAYAYPYSSIPGLKSGLPHQVWVPEMDPETCLPKRDAAGNYIVTKTGGLTGTMLDILRALTSQDIFMVHIVDAIEAVNRDHQGIGLGVAESEGLVVAGIDMVATDLLCARYMFGNVGIKESEETGLTDRFGGSFAQVVPVPRYNGTEIVTEKGYDCPLSRDYALSQAEKAGLGKSAYYVIGQDGITGNPLSSHQGRLGYQNNGAFHEIVTESLYWDIYKMPWDMQKTFFGYLEAVDQVEHTALKKGFLDAFDEDKDGVVSYEEYGKKGMFGPGLLLTGLYLSMRGAEDESQLFRSFFAMMATNLRGSNPQWNEEGHDFFEGEFYGSVAVVAYLMSQRPKEKPDPFCPGLNWGHGKWPSFSLATFSYVHQVIYGWRFPAQIGVFSLYGSALSFADHRQNGRQFVGTVRGAPKADAVQNYLEAVQGGRITPFDFTVFVPPGYGGNGKVPNVQETSDPKKIFTAMFEREKIQWPDACQGYAE
jgi:uncharacterized protein (DUF362 family)